MTADEYLLILERTGGDIVPLATKERWRVLQQWREVYAAGLHRATGRWKHGPYEWHVFSFDYARCLDREQAAAAYADERAEEFVVCPESVKLPTVRVSNGALPAFRWSGDDIDIWPAGLDWTMAFTHEESIGLGPYFCRREWAASKGGSGRRSSRS